ncbi:MAG: methylornithine synthase PylB [Deltaproteobacteria bacterium]|jgi:methylornithine synthase|nr:methylornithine synthase PylB [Deltaproteobacteria bacterium]
MNDSNPQLAKILEKALREEILDGNEVVFLLSLERESQIDAVFRTAREMRSRYFGNRIFLYGFVYLSTYCRNECNFCYFRKSNALPDRYRREVSEVVEAAQRLAESGVHLIDLTLGEDPRYFEDRGFDPLIQMVEGVRQATDLPIMISPGVVPADVLSDFARAGVSWYACYQETHNRKLFKRLRPGQSYDARLENKRRSGPLGLLTEEGLLCGIGESPRDIADSIEVMRSLEVSQMRAMSFVPQEGTPLQSWKEGDPRREILTLAILRLMFPDRLIPATLDVEGLSGLHSRLEAGANVVTSIVPPGFGLAGVAQSSLDIADARRTIDSIAPELEKLGLQAARLADYSSWIEDRRRQIQSGLSGEETPC